jgi:hypothetical protein
VPWVPDGSVVEVIARVTGAMTIEKDVDMVCAGFPASATLAVKLNVPVDVGVPAMIPVVVLKLRPFGRAPEVMVQA